MVCGVVLEVLKHSVYGLEVLVLNANMNWSQASEIRYKVNFKFALSSFHRMSDFEYLKQLGLYFTKHVEYSVSSWQDVVADLLDN